MTVAAFLGQLATGFAFFQANDAAQSEQAMSDAREATAGNGRHSGASLYVNLPL